MMIASAVETVKDRSCEVVNSVKNERATFIPSLWFCLGFAQRNGGWKVQEQPRAILHRLRSLIIVCHLLHDNRRRKRSLAPAFFPPRFSWRFFSQLLRARCGVLRNNSWIV